MKYQDLEITRKSTRIYEILFKNVTTGEAENITGWTIYFTVKINVEDEDSYAKINKAVTDHASAIEGKTLINLESTDTDIDAGIYWYSMDWKDENGNQGILYYGKLKIAEPIRKVRA